MSGIPTLHEFRRVRGVCCASAAIYNLVQPTEAAELGQIKAADLSATGADWVASANIGCSLQIRQHMGAAPRPIPVAHPMQLLDWSFRGVATSGFGLLRSSKPPVPVNVWWRWLCSQVDGAWSE